MVMTEPQIKKKRESKKLKRKQQQKLKDYVKFVAKHALSYQDKYIKYRSLAERAYKENVELVTKNNKLLRHWNLLASKKGRVAKWFVRLFQGRGA